MDNRRRGSDRCAPATQVSTSPCLPYSVDTSHGSPTTTPPPCMRRCLLEGVVGEVGAVTSNVLAVQPGHPLLGGRRRRPPPWSRLPRSHGRCPGGGCGHARTPPRVAPLVHPGTPQLSGDRTRRLDVARHLKRSWQPTRRHQQDRKGATGGKPCPRPRMRPPRRLPHTGGRRARPAAWRPAARRAARATTRPAYSGRRPPQRPVPVRHRGAGLR
jgi:hypothetical protein